MRLSCRERGHPGAGVSSGMMKEIVLIGMPGAGKSTVGVLLAKTLKRPFVDTDLLIQAREHRFLREIIAHDGMDAFLNIEARVIGELDLHGQVIATGGSVIYREAAMAHLRAHGIIMFLSLPYPIIARRIHNIATRGIAMRPGQTLRSLYDERQPLYEHYAEITIDGSAHLTAEQTVTRITQALAGYAEVL